MKDITKNLIVYSMLLLSAFCLAVGTWYAEEVLLLVGLCIALLSTFVAWLLKLI
jgi:hypothetical protein